LPQVTDTKEVTIATQGFAQGVNIQDAPNLLTPTEVRRAENGLFDERGGFTKRSGCQNQGTVGASGDRILSTYVFYRGEGVIPHFMIHTSAGAVYYTTDPVADPTNPTPVYVNWTPVVVSGFSISQPMSWETFNGKCYFCDGTHYSSWDGTTYATYPSAPKGKYIRLYKDTMWVAGVAGLPDRVYSSNPGDAETWPAASWVDIRHGDGDSIRGLATDGVYLIVGKRNTGTIIYDPALFYNRVFDYEKGIESHWSVIQHESSIFYLTRRGIAEWQGDAPASLISYKIDPLFDPHILNYNNLQYAWAYSFGQVISWCLAEIGSTVPTMQVNYYPRLAELTALGIRGLGPWSIDRIPVQCASVYRYMDKVRLYGGSTTANKFYWVFADGVGQDDGTTFTAILETGAYDFGAPILTKYLRRMRILGRGRFNVQLKRNFQNSFYRSSTVDLSGQPDVWNSHVWNTQNWGPDANVKETTVNPDAYARFFSVVFSDTDPAAGTMVIPVGSKDFSRPTGQWSILGCILDGQLLGVRNT